MNRSPTGCYNFYLPYTMGAAHSFGISALQAGIRYVTEYSIFLKFLIVHKNTNEQ